MVCVVVCGCVCLCGVCGVCGCVCRGGGGYRNVLVPDGHVFGPDGNGFCRTAFAVVFAILFFFALEVENFHFSSVCVLCPICMICEFLCFFLSLFLRVCACVCVGLCMSVRVCPRVSVCVSARVSEKKHKIHMSETCFRPPEIYFCPREA